MADRIRNWLSKFVIDMDACWGISYAKKMDLQFDDLIKIADRNL